VVEKEFLNNIFGKRAKPKLKIPNDLKNFLRVIISIHPLATTFFVGQTFPPQADLPSA